MNTPLMLDLCAGLGGASAQFRAAGWDVVTLDYDPRFGTDIVADIRGWSWYGRRPDLVWASPPCDEFSREHMPWSKTGAIPDMSLVLACKRVIDECRPAWWVIENVKGACRWFAPHFGKWRAHYGPFYLWGNFPDIGKPPVVMRKKESYSSTAHAERAMIPARLSLAMLRAIERQPALLKV